MDQNEVAEKLFGAPYSHLSSWGQDHVNNMIRQMDKMDVPRTTTLQAESESAKLTSDNERLARELESARLENLDLWDENTELKSDLAELQAKFNPPKKSFPNNPST